MLTTHRSARILPVAALFIAAIGACSDNSPPTAPLTLHPRLTQLAASPVVNSLADPGTGGCDDTECTLREAIAFASSGATITFSVTGTITLSGSNLSVSRSLTISGPGATQLTVSGNGASRVFSIDAATTISGLTITGGYTGTGGGGILAWADLTLIDCVVTNNSGLSSVGGGIYQVLGTMIVKSSTVSANTGHNSASGVYTNGTAVFINSTVSGNHDVMNDPGVGIQGASGTLVVDHCTITGQGAGVQARNAAVSVRGSLISENSADVQLVGTGSFTSLGYNLIGTSSPVTLLATFSETGDMTAITNANIGTLTLNSPGQTPTFALLAGSLAIDGGVCTDYTGATLTTDQRGVSRPQGSECDIGAYELQVSGGTTPTFAFDLSALSAKTFGDGSFSVSGYASTNSTGAVTFATGAGSVGCSISSAGMVSITGAAVNPSACILEASLAADATYTSAGPISRSFNIAKATGSVTINNMPASGTVGGSFTPTYIKSGDGTSSTVSNSTSVCTVSSGVVNYIAAGACLLQAQVTEGTNHLASTGSEQSLTISAGPLDPGFTFDVSALGIVTYGNVPFGINGFAHTNSSGYISFALGSGSVGCSVSTGGTLTITAAAIDPNHCIVEASVAADATYSGAGPISQSFNIAKATGSVTINNIPASGSVGGSFTPAYAKSGDGTASTLSNSTSVCTVTSGVVNFIAAGTCLLQASLTEGTNYLSATGSEQNFSVSLVTPTFAFDLSALSEKKYGDGNFSVATHATTSSTGPVTFALGTGSVGCSVTSAGMVTITGVALDPIHCVLAATVAAHGSYAGAGPIEQSFNILKAPGSVTISNMPVSATVGGQFTPTFTKSGDGSASVASLTTGVCTVTGGIVDFIAEGTCILQASVTEGTNHLAVTGGQQNVTVSPLAVVFASTCTYTINAKNNQRQVTISWENADPGVTKIELVDGRVVTKQLAPTTAGSWSTSVKTGEPTYGLWGGTARRDATTPLIASGSACSLIP